MFYQRYVAIYTFEQEKVLAILVDMNSFRSRLSRTLQTQRFIYIDKCTIISEVCNAQIEIVPLWNISSA